MMFIGYIPTTLEDRQRAVDILVDMMEFRMKEKGENTFASSWEIYGRIIDETEEFREAIHEGVIEGIHRGRLKGGLKGELTDIAVAAVFGVASILALERSRRKQ
jgi:hypothetical protein